MSVLTITPKLGTKLTLEAGHVEYDGGASLSFQEPVPGSFRSLWTAVSVGGLDPTVAFNLRTLAKLDQEHHEKLRPILEHMLAEQEADE